jgi:Domain of Unknown Function (DUF1080)
MTTRRIVIAATLALIAAGGLPGTASRALAQDAAQDAGKETWVPLFNSKDLSGWTDALDNASSWRVVGGVLEGRGGGKGQPALLVTERQDFTNFRLRVQFGCRKPGGGGIELRRSCPAEGTTNSYEVSVGVNPHWLAARRPPGNVTKLKHYRYGGQRPPPHESELIKAAVNCWHTLECHVVGNTITTYVNGRKADEFTDSKGLFRSGGIALFCYGDSVVQFREVSTQELPAE